MAKASKKVSRTDATGGTESEIAAMDAESPLTIDEAKKLTLIFDAFPAGCRGKRRAGATTGQ